MTAAELLRLLDKAVEEVAREDEAGEDAVITLRAYRRILAVASEFVEP